MIVDITTTGATLTANELKILDDGTILESEASLVASTGADWTTDARNTARALLDRISARVKAKSSQILEFASSISTPALLEKLCKEFGAEVLSSATSESTSLLVPDKQLSSIVALLRQHAPATSLATHKPNQVFGSANVLFEKLTRALS